MKNIIITGGAGFIGSNLVDFLLQEGGYNITIIDNLDSFYDLAIKEKNIAGFKNNPNVNIIRQDIRDIAAIKAELPDLQYDMIIHLAAKAGVRPSILSPVSYYDTNVNGTLNMLELAKEKKIRQFVFASSSSVYGVNPNVPWQENTNMLSPISPYASSKIAGEAMGHTYAHLYGIRFIALRFFTVFGPRQRPDLAIHKFFKAIKNDKPITVYGDGSTYRDYTFVLDIVRGIRAAMYYDKSDFEIINLGNNKPIDLSSLIKNIEITIGKEAIINRMEEQQGDVPLTCANIELAKEKLGYEVQTPLLEGLKIFNDWLEEQSNH
jgi:UDP-glucuronate 4-epimerase